MEYGMKDGNGVIIQDVTRCAITGQAIEAGDALVGVAGTPYFVRIKAGAYATMLEEQWREIQNAVPQSDKKTKQGSKS